MSLAGPTITETITGGKSLEMTDYDRIREPHPAITDNTEIKITTRTLATELSCPICLDLLTSTMTTKECLHRFCSECITTALMRGNKECPTCRKKIVSKRALRPDPNFDALISKIWPDRKVYEDMEFEASRRFNEQTSIAALQKSIEVGIKEQAVHRRQRIQGSYDYEKRKRRPKVDPSGAESSAAGTESQANDDVEMQDLENPQENETTANESNARGRAPLVRMESNGATSSTDESDTTSDSTLTSSDSSNTESSDASSATTVASTSKPEPPPKPPTARCSLKDKMSKWLDTSSSSPLTPSDDNIVEATSDGLSDELRRRWEEIEVELVPSKSLLGRKNIAEVLMINRFIRAPADTTMGHLSEFLKEVCHEDSENENSTKEGEILAPEYFYVKSRDDQVRKVFLPENLYNAFTVSEPSSNHLSIFFDVSPPDVNCTNLFVEIVGNEPAVKEAPVEDMEE